MTQQLLMTTFWFLSRSREWFIRRLLQKRKVIVIGEALRSVRIEMLFLLHSCEIALLPRDFLCELVFAVVCVRAPVCMCMCMCTCVSSPLYSVWIHELQKLRSYYVRSYNKIALYYLCAVSLHVIILLVQFKVAMKSTRWFYATFSLFWYKNKSLVGKLCIRLVACKKNVWGIVYIVAIKYIQGFWTC